MADKLLSEFDIGFPPYEWDKISQLRDHALTLANRLQPGQLLECDELLRMIEILEGWTGSLARGTVQFRDSQSPSDVRSLPCHIWQLKESLFQTLEAPQITEEAYPGRRLCHHCNLAFERIATRLTRKFLPIVTI
jgi:hypothetical protein